MIFALVNKEHRADSYLLFSTLHLVPASLILSRDRTKQFQDRIEIFLIDNIYTNY
jgi:hypothetical protein